MIPYNDSGGRISFIFQLQGSVLPKAFLFALPSAVIAALLIYVEDNYEEFNFRTSNGLHEENMRQAKIWLALVAPITLMLGFRVEQALDRFWEGTGLLHQMRGEWFDAVSCVVAFSRQAKAEKPQEVAQLRGTIVRLASLLHGFALHELKDLAHEQFEVVDMRGLCEHTVNYLAESKLWDFDRFEVLLHMMHCVITEAQANGLLKVPPPVLTRVYQELSQGMVNLHNAKKLTDTQFPFPYVQLIAMVLLGQSIVAPILVTAYIHVAWWAALVSFLPIFGMWAVNFMVTQLEMPFGDDINDLPLHFFQEEMNRSLLMLIHSEADCLARTGKTAKWAWDELTVCDAVDIDRFFTPNDMRHTYKDDNGPTEAASEDDAESLALKFSPRNLVL